MRYALEWKVESETTYNKKLTTMSKKTRASRLVSTTYMRFVTRTMLKIFWQLKMRLR